MDKFIVGLQDGGSSELIEGNFEDWVYKSNRDRTILLTWTENQKEYSLTSIHPFQFFPIFNERKIGVIYFKDEIFIHPDNLVIYNADQTIYKVERVPAFINEKILNDPNVQTNKLGKFENFKGLEQINGVDHLLVNISTETYLGSRMGECSTIEVRALNPENGQFDPNWSLGGIYW